MEKEAKSIKSPTPPLPRSESAGDKMGGEGEGKEEGGERDR